MSDSHGGFDDHGGPNHKARILLISQGFARQLDGPGNKSYLNVHLGRDRERWFPRCLLSNLAQFPPFYGV